MPLPEQHRSEDSTSQPFVRWDRQAYEEDSRVFNSPSTNDNSQNLFNVINSLGDNDTLVDNLASQVQSMNLQPHRLTRWALCIRALREVVAEQGGLAALPHPLYTPSEDSSFWSADDSSTEDEGWHEANESPLSSMHDGEVAELVSQTSIPEAYKQRRRQPKRRATI